MATPQCLAAMWAATSKRARPTMATAGAIVNGVMYFSTKPMMPGMDQAQCFHFAPLGLGAIHLFNEVDLY